MKNIVENFKIKKILKILNLILMPKPSKII
jgi:hypothetical protein